ncbi:MAG: acyl carrier protein [Verrucomicrobiota bacterium]
MKAPFPLARVGDPVSPFARMAQISTPDSTELIDWLHSEGLLELDWDFPADGNLFEVGMDSMAVMQIVVAVEDHYGVELIPEDLSKENIETPEKLAALIASKRS